MVGTTITVGPGTELKLLLKRMGFVARGCKCEEHAAQMDDWGPDVCEENIETIVDWLGQEASKRHLPYNRFIGRLLVRRAIKNARKKLGAMTR